jgi:hypothetical protein
VTSTGVLATGRMHKRVVRSRRPDSDDRYVAHCDRNERRAAEANAIVSAASLGGSTWGDCWVLRVRRIIATCVCRVMPGARTCLCWKWEEEAADGRAVRPRLDCSS